MHASTSSGEILLSLPRSQSECVERVSALQRTIVLYEDLMKCACVYVIFPSELI
jgi:hypothetical protein